MGEFPSVVRAIKTREEDRDRKHQAPLASRRDRRCVCSVNPFILRQTDNNSCLVSLLLSYTLAFYKELSEILPP
jgi:hypothetical protein